MVKKIIIALILTPIAIAALAVTAVLIVLNYPHILINDHALGIAARHLKPLGVGLEWKNVSANSTSHGFADETVNIDFDGLCVRYEPTLEKACFKHIGLAGRYRFTTFIPELVALGPVSVTGGEIAATLPADEKKAEEKKPPTGKIAMPRITLPGWLHGVELYPVNVEIDELAVHQGDTTYRAKTSVTTASDEQHLLSTIKVVTSANETPGGRKIDVDIEAESSSGFLKEDWKLDASVKATLGAAGTASVDATAEATEAGGIDHSIEVSYRKDRLTASARIEGSVKTEEVDLKVDGAAHGIADMVPGIEIRNCTVKLAAKEIRRNRGEMELSCPIDVILKEFALPPEMKEIYRPPRRVHIDISSKANMPFIPDMDGKMDGMLTVRIEPEKNKLVRTKGDAKINFAGVPSKGPKSWKVETNIDIDFIIDEFSKLAKVMDATPYPVPAPFNVLDGSIEFSLEGKLSGIGELGHFPAKLATKLASKDQRIFIDSEGEARIGRKGADVEDADIKLDVKLADVQLQLPNIALAGIPRFTPDGRIILHPPKEAEKKKADIPLEYDIHVSTPDGKPVRILSNITPKYIPINIDVDMTNDGMSGTIRVTDFPIKLFSRNAILEKLNIDLMEPVESSTVDGSLSMQFPELKVIITMLGPFEHPSITLSSDPAMSQGDIISTLLYGEPMDSIDADQASSVNSMNAAMSDRAMAITSFFLLGSTPIQSIAYNPQTKVFTAKVRLGKKTSFTVGGSSEEQHAGIRRRLGKGWSVTTSVDKNDSDSTAAASAMIEWSKRF